MEMNDHSLFEQSFSVNNKYEDRGDQRGKGK